MMGDGLSPKKKKRVVLPEDEYQQNLSRIIRRDYFPALHRLKRETGAEHRPNEIIIRPDYEGGNLLDQDSLTGFHARVTSEDNVAFTEQLRREALTKEETNQRLLEQFDPSHATAGSLTPSNLASGDRKLPTKASSRNALFFVPDSSTQLVRTDNGTDQGSMLMPPPQQMSLSNNRSIEPAATRFPEKPPAPARPLADEWDDESDLSDSDASTNLDDDDTDCNLEMAKQRARRRKEKELETLVRMTPLIDPGASPIVTWGTVGGSPLLVAGSDGPRTSRAATQAQVTRLASELPAQNSAADASEACSFRIPQTSGQEQAAHQAQARIARRVRRSRETPLSKKTSLSTAAKQFMKKRTSTRPLSARSAASLGSALRSSYGSSTARSSSGRPRKSIGRKDTAFRATPLPCTKK